MYARTHPQCYTIQKDNNISKSKCQNQKMMYILIIRKVPPNLFGP